MNPPPPIMLCSYCRTLTSKLHRKLEGEQVTIYICTTCGCRSKKKGEVLRTHFAHEGHAACGSQIHEVPLTKVKTRVNCEACKLTRWFKSRFKRGKKTTPSIPTPEPKEAQESSTS